MFGLGPNEFLLVGIVLILLLIVPVAIAYKMGKQMGRLIEIERQRQEKEYQQ